MSKNTDDIKIGDDNSRTSPIIFLTFLVLSQAFVWFLGWILYGLSDFNTESTFRFTILEYVLIYAGILYAYEQRSRLLLYMELAAAVTFFSYFYLQVI